jgi:YYY domain-containing protein
MIASLILWWLALQILGLIALPITARLFEPLSLKGYVFAKTTGLLTVGYGIWLLATFGWIHFSATGVFLVGVVVLAIGLWAVGRSGLRGLMLMVRTHWPLILAYETLFAALLLGGLWLRWHGAVGAAITGTEKPMDLTFLSGILHSDTFPPHDPWLAGYAINYYYLGYLMLAVLAVLTGASAGEAFNLGLATTFALTGLMVAGLVVALVGQARQHAGERASTGGAGAAALLGVVFVLVLGNQAGAWQVLAGSPKVVALDGRQLVSAMGQRLSGQNSIEIDPPLRTPEGDFGTISELTPESSPPFNWWWPSRAVWDEVEVSPGVVERHYAITEFPFFSFYLGDLHPHVLALPFNLLVLALALSALIRPLPGTAGVGVRRWLPLAVSALVLGSLYAINSWDTPTYMLLYVGALILGYRRQLPGEKTSRVLGRALPAVSIVIAAAVLSIAPFLLTFQSFAGGGPVPQPWASIPVIGQLGAILLPAPDHTDLHEFIGIFGLFALVLLVYAAGGRRGDFRGLEDFGGMAWLWPAGGLLVGLLIGMPLLALLPLAAVCTRAAWRCSERPARAFVLWATAVGALVVLGADLIYLRDPFENRMNTLFKFYYQAWVIWGTAAAFATWALWQRAWRRPSLAVAWSVPALLLGLGALVYPLATLGWGQAWFSGPPALDGLAFLQESAPDEAAALVWIARNTQPRDIVLTAAGSSYDDATGRVAAVTGRPTLLGWSGSHERLWRRRSPEVLDEIAARERDIPVIYTTTSPAVARQLLERYHVQYLFVGPAERRLYGGPGLDKFDAFLELVFQQGQVRIYRCS